MQRDQSSAKFKQFIDFFQLLHVVFQAAPSVTSAMLGEQVRGSSAISHSQSHLLRLSAALECLLRPFIIDTGPSKRDHFHGFSWTVQPRDDPLLPSDGPHKEAAGVFVQPACFTAGSVGDSVRRCVREEPSPQPQAEQGRVLLLVVAAAAAVLHDAHTDWACTPELSQCRRNNGARR